MQVFAKFLESDRFPRWRELEIDAAARTAAVDGRPVDYHAAVETLADCDQCVADDEQEFGCRALAAELA